MLTAILGSLAILVNGTVALADDRPAPKPPQYSVVIKLTECLADGKERCLVNPTLIVQDGRAGTFQVGGEVPFKLADGTIRHKPYGTYVKLTPKRGKEGPLNMEVNLEDTVLERPEPLYLSTSRVETLVEDIEAQGADVTLPKVGKAGVTIRLRIEVEELVVP